MTKEIINYNKNEIAPAAIQPLSPFGSVHGFEVAQRMAQALATSNFTPKEFKNNIGDCLIVLETASRTGMPIMALLQNTYVVHGKPSFSSSFMAGLINGSGRFDEPLQFIYNEDRTSCYAMATKGGKEYRGITITVEMADKEGWLNRKGSKWKTMPELMLQYRATSFFARAYCADILMGMSSVDEAMDMGDALVTGESPVAKNLNERFSGGETIDAKTGEVTPKHPDPELASELPENLKKALADKEKSEAGQAEPEKKNVRTRPSVVASFKEEINVIDDVSHMENWSFKHQKRVIRELPKESDQQTVFTYADNKLSALKELRNEPPPPEEPGTGSSTEQREPVVLCPKYNENVPVNFCNNNCELRDKCPMYSTDDQQQGPELNIGV